MDEVLDLTWLAGWRLTRGQKYFFGLERGLEMELWIQNPTKGKRTGKNGIGPPCEISPPQRQWGKENMLMKGAGEEDAVKELGV